MHSTCIGNGRFCIMNKNFAGMSGDELRQLRGELCSAFEGFKSRGLKLDMSRGKPAPDQLDLCDGVLDKFGSCRAEEMKRLYTSTTRESSPAWKRSARERARAADFS